MWIVFARAPRPDAADWPARRPLAALDAVAWPLVAMAVLLSFGESTRLLGALGAALLGVLALSRLTTAACFNGRYWFTTWFDLAPGIRIP